MDGFGWLTGRDVHEVAHPIFRNLEEKGRLYRHDLYTHRYPLCWRCGTPLVFRLVDEWFINMGPLYDKPREELTPEEKAASLRYQIMDVADQITWIPDFGHDARNRLAAQHARLDDLEALLGDAADLGLR